MSEPAGGETVYLSPHLDDAVLSCGGRIAEQALAGCGVVVLTVFAADEPGEGISDFAAGLHRLFGLERAVVAARRREDAAACARLGARPEHWREPEAIYRRDPAAGRFLYAERDSLLGPPDPADDPLMERLAERLRRLPRDCEVVCPLAVGGHVDHRLVRSAAEAARGDRLTYYEDYPYVEWSPQGLDAALEGDGWSPLGAPLPAAALAAKLRAVGEYRSQLRPLFGGRWRMARKIRRFTRSRGGERLWRRGSPG